MTGLRLDAFEVTVGRFRQFVDAWDRGFRPAAGSGVHTHLNGGRGLVNSGAGGGFEPGWSASWNPYLASDANGWERNLTVCQQGNTWTPSPTSGDDRPVNCETWYEAYAFCIWDGGFLPSEAELNDAFMGGSEERIYPWGQTAPAADDALAIYDCYYSPTSGPGGSCGLDGIAPVGSSPAGNGKWGQADLAGSMWEWVLDFYANPYASSTCDNCANTTGPSGPTSSGPFRVLLGGGFDSNAGYLEATYRSGVYGPTSRFSYYGVRCARTP